MSRHALWAALACAVWVGCDDDADADPNDGGVEAGTDASDDGVTDATTADAKAEVDGAPDAAPEITQPRFDPDGTDFYDTPWPSDARLTELGTPDLSLFPATGSAFLRIIDEIQDQIVGFATMPVMFVAFEGVISDLPVPTPISSTAANSPVQLVELGEGCGTRVPLEVSVRMQDERYVAAETLQAKNTVGTVLEPRTPYALVVLRSFGVPRQRALSTPEAFSAAWAGDGSRWDASLQPLRDCVETAAIDPADIVVATVFTPQDPVAELQAMHDLVMDPNAVETRAPSELQRDAAWSRRRLAITTYSGLVEMPIFQTGAPPYATEGGAVEFDGEGTPIIQRWEAVPIAVAMRDFEAPPPGPRPALVFIDGTGWEPWGHLHSGWLRDILDAGFVVFSYMPQFHGGRAGTEGGPEVPTFNLFNPPAGRTNFRQQAVENAFFSRVVREQLAGFEGLPEIDVERVVYGGHSQGALTGAITAGIASTYAAYVLNGLSSYLTLTILERKDYLDFEAVVRTLLSNDRPLEIFSPALHLMQLASEAVDPHNYARLWRGTEARPEGNHVFVINGFHDDTTTPRGMDHLTISADLPTFDPPGWEIDPFGIGEPPRVQPPVRGNAESVSGDPLTLATYMDPYQGHFTIYRSGILRQMTVGFWQSALAGEVPLLEPDRELMCGDGEDGDGDGEPDCGDDDCVEREPCLEVVCDDAIDGDLDGDTDCLDADCRDHAACQEPDCGDGRDEDNDGLIDCADPGCAEREPCAEARCRDREDGDNDGLTDCDDPDCMGVRACREFSCRNEEDDDGDGLTDCEDEECLGSLACPEPDCADGRDEDGNGLADCADPRCTGQEACPAPAETVCDDEADDDDDGLVDCDDPDCAPFEACPRETCADGDLGQATGLAVFQGTLEARPDTWDPGDCTALGSGKDAPDLALLWTAPAEGTYFVSTLGSEADTVLTAFPPDCDRALELACNDDQRGVDTSALSLELEEGASVVLVISAFNAEEAGPVVLHIEAR